MYIPLLFTIFATLIIIGFLSNQFFHRIKIPDSVILILIGIILGPLTGFFQPESFLALAGVMASIAIMVIMFEAGMLLDINKILYEAPKGLLYATLHYVLTTTIVSFIAFSLFRWDFIYCVMLGALLGGTSAAVVIPIANKLRMDPDERTVLEIETTVTNVYNIIIVLSVAQIALASTFDFSQILNDIFGAFAISIMLGVVFGIAWQNVIKRMGTHPFLYMLTLAVLMYLYAFSEFVHANGPLAALVFGIVLTNFNIVSPLRTMHLIQLHREISFFIRVFFFVFLGIIFSMTPDPLVWIMAGIIATVSVVTRYFSSLLLGLSSKEIFTSLIPRGLGEAVIVSMLLQMGIEHASYFLDITSATILLTNIVTAIFVYYIEKRSSSSRPSKNIFSSAG